MSSCARAKIQTLTSSLSKGPDYGKPHSVPFTVTPHVPLYLNLCNLKQLFALGMIRPILGPNPWTHPNRKQGTRGRRRRRKEWLGHLSFAPEINGMPWQCTALALRPLKNTWCVGLGENCQPDTYNYINYIHTQNQHNIIIILYHNIYTSIIISESQCSKHFGYGNFWAKTGISPVWTATADYQTWRKKSIPTPGCGDQSIGMSFPFSRLSWHGM